MLESAHIGRPLHAQVLDQTKSSECCVSERPSRLVLAAWMAACLTLGAQYIAAVRSPSPDHFADLHVYWGAVQQVLSGSGLYDYAASNGDPFTYPPFAAIVFLPLGLLNETAAQWVWCLGEVCALVVISWYAAAEVNRENNWSSPLVWPAATAALALSAPVASNIHFGQVSLMVSAATVTAVLGRRGRGGRGVALGLAAGTKLTPLALWPFLIKTQLRVAAVATASFCATVILGMVLLPDQSSRYWLHLLPKGAGYGDISKAGNQSLMGVMLRQHIAPEVSTQVVAAVAIPLLLWAFRRALRAYREGKPLVGYVIMSGAAVLLSPVSWTHHQIPLILAAAWQVSSRRTVQLCFSSLVFLVMTVNLSALHIFGMLDILLDESRFLLCLALTVLVPIRTYRSGHANDSSNHPDGVRSASRFVHN
jgi:alpha-1,2-mannosyltransferase